MNRLHTIVSLVPMAFAAATNASIVFPVVGALIELGGGKGGRYKRYSKGESRREANLPDHSGATVFCHFTEEPDRYSRVGQQRTNDEKEYGFFRCLRC